MRGIVVDGVDATEQLALAHRALHDPLTGVANRVLLSDRLTHAMSRLDRSRRPLMVAYVDLDRFKAINDKLGHDMGDAVLVEVASRLTVSVRPGDTVARIGGDEFVILCPDLPDASLADDLAQRLITAVSEPMTARCRDARDDRERRARARAPPARRRTRSSAPPTRRCTAPSGRAGTSACGAAAERVSPLVRAS